jgi:hypothetical protein
MFQSWEPWFTLFICAIGFLSLLACLRRNGRFQGRPISRLAMICIGMTILGLQLSMHLPLGDQQSLSALIAEFILFSFVLVFAFLAFDFVMLSVSLDDKIVSRLPWSWLRRLAEQQAASEAAERTVAQARREARRQAQAARRQA